MRRLAGICLFLLMSFGVTITSPVPQASAAGKPSTHIEDTADIYTPEFELVLSQKLQDLSLQKPPVDLNILTVSSLEGETITELSQTTMESWKVGRENEVAGVLLVVSTEDKAIRIHTSHGAENWLSDDQAQLIINESMAPFFQQAAYEEGTEAGVDSIISLSQGISLTPANQPKTIGQTWWVVVLYCVLLIGMITLVVLASVWSNKKQWLLGPVAGLIIGGVIGGPVVGALLTGLGTGVSIWKHQLHKGRI
jgi:uncharacterized protein